MFINPSTDAITEHNQSAKEIDHILTPSYAAEIWQLKAETYFTEWAEEISEAAAWWK